MALVFLCHAREDAALAFRLSESLKEAGFETWLDQERMLPGQHWPAETRRAIRQCDFFIALLSSRSLSKRGFVQREIKEALDVMKELPDFQTFLIPVRLDDCEIQNEVLRGIQWLDLFPSWEKGVSLLTQTFQRRERRPEGEPSPVPAPARFRSPLARDIVRDVLRLDVVARRNYLPRLLAGAALLTSAFVVAVFLVERFEFGSRDHPWEGPSAGALFLVSAASMYLLLSGASRWRLSFQARRDIVRANEVVCELFARNHPFLYRLHLGRWYWRMLLTVAHILLAATGLSTLLLLAVSVDLAVNGDLGAMAFFLFAGSSPGLLVLVALRHMHRVWRSYQEKAGALER